MTQAVSQVAAAAHEVSEVTIERAYEIVETMKNTTKHDTGSTVIFRGLSVLYGMVYIAVPPLGNALILPFASQS